MIISLTIYSSSYLYNMFKTMLFCATDDTVMLFNSTTNVYSLTVEVNKSE